MTLAELTRLLESKRRMQKLQAQERASYDYILADLIGRSIARVYHSANTMPDISAAYPTLFDGEEIRAQKAQKQAELSALRFMQFAQAHNKKYEEVGRKDE